MVLAGTTTFSSFRRVQGQAQSSTDFHKKQSVDPHTQKKRRRRKYVRSCPRFWWSVSKKTQHDLLNSAPGLWDCRRPEMLKNNPWDLRHQFFPRTQEPCKSGVLFKKRTGSNYSACSTASTSSLRRSVNKTGHDTAWRQKRRSAKKVATLPPQITKNN